MIEITERFAICLNVAVKVLTKKYSKKDNPLTWIRSMRVRDEEPFWLRYNFWVNGNPNESIVLDVQYTLRFSKPIKPLMVIVRTSPAHSERWDINELGKPIRNK